MTVRVGVVTVTYNSGVALDRFLASLPAGSAHPLDVVVVDNHSAGAAESARAAAEHGARFIGLDENRGYGGGVNAAVAALRDVDWILIANPDTVVDPGSIDELVRRATARPNAGAVGPLVRNPDGSVYPSARRLPSLREGIGHVLFVNVWPDNPWTRRYRQPTSAPAERETGWLSGSCLLVPAPVFAELGGFDDGYFMYFEDVDFGARVLRSGRVNLYVPSAAVTHTGAHSTTGSAGAMQRAHHRSAYRYLSRKYSAWWLWPLRAVLRVALAARMSWNSRRSA